MASAPIAKGSEGLMSAQTLGFRPCSGCLRVFFEMGAFHQHLDKVSCEEVRFKIRRGANDG